MGLLSVVQWNDQWGGILDGLRVLNHKVKQMNFVKKSQNSSPWMWDSVFTADHPTTTRQPVPARRLAHPLLHVCPNIIELFSWLLLHFL